MMQKSTKQIGKLGSAADVETLARRLILLYGIPEDAQKEAMSAVRRAAQLVVAYGFLPRVHVNVWQGHGDDEPWVVDVGVRGWMDSADRLAQRMRFRYMVETRVMTPDEVRTATPPDVEYDLDDVGVAARVLRSDHIELHKSMNREYDPPWVYGFWRVRAYRLDQSDPRSGWVADVVYKGRTPADVAELRARKAALMAVFTLQPLDEREAEQRAATAIAFADAEIEERRSKVERQNRDAVLPAPKQTKYEPDGDVLWA
jgi:hypothetical protein